ncbi:hypothetical protein C8R45DRAFT_492477 [Mycena sanguinolenta]|nr:hypothetical protein C8R45DRAFT_492477 [Mycena sanguinolenta]
MRSQEHPPDTLLVIFALPTLVFGTLAALPWYYYPGICLRGGVFRDAAMCAFFSYSIFFFFLLPRRRRLLPRCGVLPSNGRMYDARGARWWEG